MAPNLSVQQKDRIQQQVFNKTPINVIAHIEYIHKTTVYRIIDNFLAFGYEEDREAFRCSTCSKDWVTRVYREQTMGISG